MRELSWTSQTLGDVLTLEYGSALPASHRFGQEFPVFGSSGEVGRHAKPLVEGPGIIVGRKGSVGQVSWTDIPFWPIDTAYFVAAKDADLRWLYWTLLRLPLQRLDTSTGVPGLNRNDAYELSIQTPPAPEQRQIATVLDTIDDAVRKTEQIIAKLKQVKQGLLHDLLTRGIDDNGELRDPTRHPEQFKDSPLGLTPRQWEVVPIRRMTSFLSYGFTNPMPTTEEGPWMLTAADISDGAVLWSTARRTSEQAFRSLLTAKSRPAVGDLLLTKDGTLGRIAVLDRACVCINQSVAVLRFADEWMRDMVFTYLRSPGGQFRLLADAGGSTIKHIYISKLGDMLVPKPSRHEALHIVAIATECERKLDAEGITLRKLGALKRGIMEDLLTGRVRVTPLLPAP